MNPANQLELFNGIVLIGKTLKFIFSLALNHSISLPKASILAVLNLPFTNKIVLIKPSVLLIVKIYTSFPFFLEIEP